MNPTDKTKDVYKVIHNPTKMWAKEEVWISGEVACQYMYSNKIHKEHQTRCIASFRKPEAAQEYIDYQIAVAEFKGTSDAI